MIRVPQKVEKYNIIFWKRIYLIYFINSYLFGGSYFEASRGWQNACASCLIACFQICSNLVIDIH